MGAGTLKVGTESYEIDEVILSTHHREQHGKHLLTVNVFADAKELSRAGFAINSLTFSGLQSVHDLENTTFSLTCDGSDDLNDLGESVLCVPGSVLEIDALELAFGTLVTKGLPIEIKAVCHGAGGPYVEVAGSFVAKIKKSRQITE